LMMKNRCWVVVLCGLLVASAALAKVSVEYAPDVDFKKFGTWAWIEGAEAGRDEVQTWIVRAVERELAGQGLTKVDSPAEADLHVQTFAAGRTDGSQAGGYNYINQWGVGFLYSDVRGVQMGTLLVILKDGANDKSVWEGIAQESFGPDIPDPRKVEARIDKVTRKMFKKYPGR